MNEPRRVAAGMLLASGMAAGPAIGDLVNRWAGLAIVWLWMILTMFYLVRTKR